MSNKQKYKALLQRYRSFLRKYRVLLRKYSNGSKKKRINPFMEINVKFQDNIVLIECTPLFGEMVQKKAAHGR